jgi:FAD/FMN-containing dehydrogenase
MSSCYRRGAAGYENARKACMWNARMPDRFPDLIVQASDAPDVVAAVRQARAEGLRIGVRSGGHSWAGNHVRDGGMLLDVSRLNQVTIDRAAGTATVGPGRKGHELAGLLARRGLFFPSGHCRGVAVGGYLLQGGFGWHGRTLGPACASVRAIDVVTAEGELVHASEHENADLYWAARGAGPGFFGVVTRFRSGAYRVVRRCARASGWAATTPAYAAPVACCRACSRSSSGPPSRTVASSVHCSQEMTHLASFLPALHAELHPDYL